MSDTDTMRQELEAAGYEIYLSQNPLRKHSWVCFDEWYFEVSDIPYIWEDNYEDIILDMLVTKAYAHLQQQHELEALRAFVLDVTRYLAPSEPTTDNHNTMGVYGMAIDLINQYNIKDDTDERH